MAAITRLKGITWNHSRGFTPMVATAQRFAELNPGVEISWEKRSLQQFADMPIAELAERYDLLVIDHPWAGFAAQTGAILALDRHLPAAFLADQAANSVGQSFESYAYNGHQWALPIDAATPVACSRPDLFAELGLCVPGTYDDLLALADRGLVAMPLIPIDTLMAFYMFCCTLGETPARSDEVFISESIGLKALQLFRELAQRVDESCFDYNPIRVYEEMSRTDRFAYCPFAYGYSNYARDGYARKALRFHDLVAVNGRKLQSTLGGTGLAVSASSANAALAIRYAEFVASPECQATLYTESGGQPGHRAAWTTAGPNRLTADYFTATLPALDRAYLRPRYAGHMYFQDRAGDPVRDHLRHGGDARHVLRKLDELYIHSRGITI